MIYLGGPIGAIFTFSEGNLKGINRRVIIMTEEDLMCGRQSNLVVASGSPPVFLFDATDEDELFDIDRNPLSTLH